MDKYILVKNVETNAMFIANKQPISIDDLPKAYQEAYNTLRKTDALNYTLVQHFDTCDIIRETEKVKVGWIYNTKEYESSVVYTLSSIDFINLEIQSSCNKGTQTLYTSTETESGNESDIESCSESGIESCNEDCIEVEALNDVYKTFTVGTGYASSVLFPSWRDNFTHELKRKLSSPNNGLRRIPRAY